MRITITGATGLIGGGLRRHLTACGHELRCLSRKAPSQPGWFAWDAISGAPPRESLEGSDAVIHLAGEPVAQRWSPEAKRRIRPAGSWAPKRWWRLLRISPAGRRCW